MLLFRSPIPILLLFLTAVRVSAGTRTDEPQKILAQADRMAILYNWPKAAPLYKQAGDDFMRGGDEKGQLSARLGWVRSQVEGGVSPALTEELEHALQSPVVHGDAQLMLRCLVARAALDQ